MVRIFGAPVIDPHGKSAPKTSTRPTPAAVRPVTVEVSCHTVGYASTSNRLGTRTDPGSQTRAMSLRSRSTIMRFSARSLAEPARSAASTASRSASRERPRVPFIGRVTTSRPSQVKKSSGDTEATTCRPVST